jgi:predicted GTPase
MPYGDLVRQKVQRFATYADLDKNECTIEEREEYEPHIDKGILVYAGVDYGAILKRAEKEADVILWDGGNNDFPFYKPDLEIVVADPLRAGHEMLYHPGETNFRRAQVIVINKMDTADKSQINLIFQNIKKFNPLATIVRANSEITVENASQIAGKRVLVIEDGPTLTHGGMKIGAGIVAAQKFGAAEIIDPRPFAVGSIKKTFQKYNHLDKVLPAMGYGEKQTRELAATINKIDCDLVVSATPIDLNRVLATHKKLLRVRYELAEIGAPTIKDILKKFL